MKKLFLSVLVVLAGSTLFAQDVTKKEQIKELTEEVFEVVEEVKEVKKAIKPKSKAQPKVKK